MRIFIQDIVHGNRMIEKGASLEEVAAKYGYGPEIVEILQYFTEEVKPATGQSDPAAKYSEAIKPKPKSRKKK